MAERPILFSGEMVRAIMDGRKTQTRRVIKPQPDDRGPRWANRWEDWHGKKVNQPPQPKDFLWVRETWQTLFNYEDLKPSEIGFGAPIKYLADFAVNAKDIHGHRMGPKFLEFGKPRQSIFMPRWVSRLTLKVKSVRAERVQDISEEDAVAEGIFTLIKESKVGLFKDLWDSINGIKHRLDPYPWNMNPWVWVISFEKWEPSP